MTTQKIWVMRTNIGTITSRAESVFIHDMCPNGTVEWASYGKMPYPHDELHPLQPEWMKAIGRNCVRKCTVIKLNHQPFFV